MRNKVKSNQQILICQPRYPDAPKQQRSKAASSSDVNKALAECFLPYDKTNEPYISKLMEDSINSINVQYIRHALKPSQLVLSADNKIVLNLEIRNDDPKLDMENAMYSNKESVALCYINIIEYQSLISEI